MTWTVGDDADTYHHNDYAFEALSIDADGDNCVVQIAFIPLDQLPLEEAHANAVTIASLPDILAAADGALAQFEGARRWLTQGQRDAVERLREVVS